jgi:GTP diphosphokinase / guanosine-3',5'-bis(diphosphate) 3'-diphosphatase
MDLEQAIQLAALAHRGQVDKNGEPYILHPLRVMMTIGSCPKRRIVAVLHDVLEDTHVTEQDLLAEGLDLELVEAVFALTRQDHETYREFIERIGKNPIATDVKLHDLRDNMDPWRNKEGPETEQRLTRYRKAYIYLFATMFAHDTLTTPAGQS